MKNTGNDRENRVSTYNEKNVGAYKENSVSNNKKNKTAAYREDKNDRFVNPYNFVPFELEGCKRSKGPEQEERVLTGYIDGLLITGQKLRGQAL